VNLPADSAMPTGTFGKTVPGPVRRPVERTTAASAAVVRAHLQRAMAVP